MSAQKTSIGIVGARGHTGAELIALIETHPRLALSFVASRELAGTRVRDALPSYAGSLSFERLDAAQVAAKGADVVVLALPNGATAPFVDAIDARSPLTLVVDLSADRRFDDGWYYGLPELTRARYAGQRRISNPGCYATAMQLAIAPLVPLLDGPAHCFGVSGYSGAGTTPSPRNDPKALRDNLMPYALVGHVHEREAARQLGCDVSFAPHVASHFRGLTVTSMLHLAAPITDVELRARYCEAYAREPLVRVEDEAPWVSQIAGRHDAVVGGFAVAQGGRRAVIVSVLDNLLKGAATQAIQNINIALGLDELEGIPHG